MSLLHIVFVSSAIASFGPRSRRWPAVLPLFALVAAVACVAIDCSFNRAVLTIVGIPSITTIAIVVDIAIARAFGRSFLSAAERRGLVLSLAIGSIVFYPSALGVIRTDFYRFGFNGAAPGVLAAIGIFLASRRRFGVAAVILLTLLALDIQLLPTVNAFDYVIDFFGGLACVIWCAVQGVKWTIAKLRAPAADPVKAPALWPA